MLDMHYPIFVKFGQRGHMEKLLKNGEVYMNTLSHFRTVENNVEQHDQLEGAERILQMKGATLSRRNPHSGVYEKIADITGGTGRIMNSNLDSIKVYCMCLIEILREKEIVFCEIIYNRVLAGFGDTAVIIYKAHEFISRVKTTANRRNLTYCHRMVEYVDMNQRHDEVGPFVKNRTYMHQNEFRIAVFENPPNLEHVSFNIGSITDIAFLCSTEELSKMRMRMRYFQ